MSDPIACTACSRAFLPRASHQQYCSDRCATRARVRRFRHRLAASRPDPWAGLGLKTLDELLGGASTVRPLSEVFAPPPPMAQPLLTFAYPRLSAVKGGQPVTTRAQTLGVTLGSSKSRRNTRNLPRAGISRRLKKRT
jgi:hypothetical protein